MFTLRPNASKLALLYLIEHLKSRGLDWIDIQTLTPHMEAMGAKTIPRARFLERLSATQKQQLVLFPQILSLED
jgi:leucyl/phenylalanyl-tRNA--protein transferase